MIVKQVILDEKLYEVQIREIDEQSFWSQKIAVAKAYAKVQGINYYPLLERLANPKKFEDMEKIDRDMLYIWSESF